MKRALFLIVVVLAPVASAALVPPAPKLASIPSVLDGPRDGDVLMLMGQALGLSPTRVPTPSVPMGLDVPTIVQRLALRQGSPISQEDAATFKALHPAVAAPVLTMLVAMEEAWTMRDQAYAHVGERELRAAVEAERAGLPAQPVLSPDEQEMVINAAIMLSDTIDMIVLPQLDALADLPVWPPIQLADPAGILRVGTTGNDTDTIDRFLQIDPQGDDMIFNNAGGAALFRDLVPGRIDAGYVIAVSIDLRGDDTYVHVDPHGSFGQGAGYGGIGLLLDVEGDDFYRCTGACQGAGGTGGVGVMRDVNGNDLVRSGGSSLGRSGGGIGFARNDAGDDEYRQGTRSAGYGSARGLGLFWERSGNEEYYVDLGNQRTFGYAETEGRGWFVDEGNGSDVWLPDMNGDPHPFAGNDRTWGVNGGRANDNRGGLAFLIAKQQP